MPQHLSYSNIPTPTSKAAPTATVKQHLPTKRRVLHHTKFQRTNGKSNRGLPSDKNRLPLSYQNHSCSLNPLGHRTHWIPQWKTERLNPPQPTGLSPNATPQMTNPSEWIRHKNLQYPPRLPNTNTLGFRQNNSLWRRGGHILLQSKKTQKKLFQLNVWEPVIWHERDELFTFLRQKMDERNRNTADLWWVSRRWPREVKERNVGKGSDT